jgi:hypothetical protein
MKSKWLDMQYFQINQSGWDKDSKIGNTRWSEQIQN